MMNNTLDISGFKAVINYDPDIGNQACRLSGTHIAST